MKRDCITRGEGLLLRCPVPGIVLSGHCCFDIEHRGRAFVFVPVEPTCRLDPPTCLPGSPLGPHFGSAEKPRVPSRRCGVFRGKPQRCRHRIAAYGFSCSTVTTVLQENLLCDPHAVHCRVSCIMGTPNYNARNSIDDRGAVASLAVPARHVSGFEHIRAEVNTRGAAPLLR